MFDKNNSFERYVSTISGGLIPLRRLLLEIIGIVISSFNPKALFLLLGPKNSGKSTFIRLLSLLVGDECVLEINDLNDLCKNGWLIAELVGKRLCACSEQPKVSLLNNTVAILKRLSGGDLVQGERKYQNPFKFYNEASIVFASNDPLILPYRDEALLNRIVVCPFKHSLNKSEQIPDLEKMLMRESGYIVYHACEALKGLIANNFEFTQIGDYTSSWSSVPDENILQRFFDECCDFDTESLETTDDIYSELSKYCDGSPPVSKEGIGRYLSQTLGLIHYKSSTHRGYRGIKIIR